MSSRFEAGRATANHSALHSSSMLQLQGPNLRWKGAGGRQSAHY
jgi:hypothetical protein